MLYSGTNLDEISMSRADVVDNSPTSSSRSRANYLCLFGPPLPNPLPPLPTFPPPKPLNVDPGGGRLLAPELLGVAALLEVVGWDLVGAEDDGCAFHDGKMRFTLFMLVYMERRVLLLRCDELKGRCSNRTAVDGINVDKSKVRVYFHRGSKWARWARRGFVPSRESVSARDMAPLEFHPSQ